MTIVLTDCAGFRAVILIGHLMAFAMRRPTRAGADQAIMRQIRG